MKTQRGITLVLVLIVLLLVTTGVLVVFSSLTLPRFSSSPSPRDTAESSPRTFATPEPSTISDWQAEQTANYFFLYPPDWVKTILASECGPLFSSVALTDADTASGAWWFRVCGPYTYDSIGSVEQFVDTELFGITPTRSTYSVDGHEVIRLDYSREEVQVVSLIIEDAAIFASMEEGYTQNGIVSIQAIFPPGTATEGSIAAFEAIVSTVNLPN